VLSIPLDKDVNSRIIDDPRLTLTHIQDTLDPGGKRLQTRRTCDAQIPRRTIAPSSYARGSKPPIADTISPIINGRVTNMGRLDDKVAVVTGAGSGIGRAIATLFASENARVLAVDRNKEGLEETARQVEEKGIQPPSFEAVVADISDARQVAELVDRTESTWGKLTTWCSNAGISIAGTIEETSVDEFERVMSVNLRGPFLGAKYAIPAMRRAGGGSIINTGSINSLIAERALCAYTTSKGGVLMLTKSVALDYASEGIRCNCLCPGFVDTPINIPHYDRLGGIDKLRASLPEWIPAGRGGEPQEIAYAALYLASDESRYVTGTTIVIDGGLTAGT